MGKILFNSSLKGQWRKPIRLCFLSGPCAPSLLVFPWIRNEQDCCHKTLMNYSMVLQKEWQRWFISKVKTILTFIFNSPFLMMTCECPIQCKGSVGLLLLPTNASWPFLWPNLKYCTHMSWFICTHPNVYSMLKSQRDLWSNKHILYYVIMLALR